MLAGFKSAVGIATNSIAVILDAVNNLSDALSSVITILGAKLAGKRPDRNHPLGHGRVEYISAMVVSAIVIYAGITALTESIKKVLHPVSAEYTTLSLVIIAVAVIVKVLLGSYVRKQGQSVDSGALVASGTDAMSDAVLSFAVLVTALIYRFTGISLEAYMGVVIAGFIIKAGIEMISDTISDILGRRADEEISRTIKELINKEPEVFGAYDLFLHNYGPDRFYGSVHIELADTMTVEEVDKLTRRIQINIFQNTGVIMTGIGVYSHNTRDDETARIRNDIQKKVLEHDWALQMHGFYLDIEAHDMRFDVVMSFDIDHREGLRILCEEISAAYPDYHITIAPDIDISD